MHKAGHCAVAALILALSGQTTFAQDVHRCVVEGKVVFQQIACRASGPTLRDQLDKADRQKAADEQRLIERARDERLRIERLDALPEDRLSTVEQLQRRIRKLDRESAEASRKQLDGRADREYQEALDRHCQGKEIETLAVGQTEQQVLNCSVYRRPTRVNTTTTAAGVRKQFIFDRGGANQHYLYFLNGVLTSFQQ